MKFSIAVILALLSLVCSSPASAQAADRNTVAYNRLHAAAQHLTPLPSLAQCPAYAIVWDGEEAKFENEAKTSTALLLTPAELLSTEELYRRIEQADACQLAFNHESQKIAHDTTLSQAKRGDAWASLLVEALNMATNETVLWYQFRSRSNSVIDSHGLWEELLLQGSDSK